MRRRDVVLGALFGGVVSTQAIAQNQKIILPGSPRIGGDLSGLTHQGKPAGDILKGQFLLLYFGTAYRVPNCQGDLMAMRAAAEDINGACRKKIITPVFIYPAQEAGDTRPPENLSLYVEAKGSPFIGLTGPRAHVLEIARGYAARYAADMNAHTRFVYVMSPEGKNLAIINADGLPHVKLGDITSLMNGANVSAPVCVY